MYRRITKLLCAAWLSWPAVLGAQDSEAPGRAELTLDDLRTFTDVFNQVRTNFVEEVDDITLLNAAIHGMITELDPHSAFLGPAEFRRLDDSSRGRYGGVGIDLEADARRIRVRQVYEHGPAGQAGIRAGDQIVAIDGEHIWDWPLHDAMAALRGEPGTEVRLRVKTGDETPRDFSLAREYIPVPSVESELLEGDIGYFRISQFHQESLFDMEDAVNELQDAIDTPLRGAILDLRNNLGGVVKQAVAVADGFLDEGLITYTHSRYQATQLEFSAKPGEWLPGVPLAVLVNRGTASASEVLAGALQDHGRGVIVGEKTYGKGSLQSVLALRNGSGLRLTTAYYFTPSGASIQGEGIQPDIVVEDTEDQETALRAALKYLRKSAAN
jgi:carboxyl-terminal processing protease